jgi:hypothetical protein
MHKEYGEEEFAVRCSNPEGNEGAHRWIEV